MKRIILVGILYLLYPSWSYSNDSTTKDNRRATIRWNVAPRFGLDQNKNGLIDLPNTTAYAVPNIDRYGKPTFKVNISANHKAPTLKELGIRGNAFLAPKLLEKTRTTKWIVNGKVWRTNKKNATGFDFYENRKYKVRAEIVYRFKNKSITYKTPVTDLQFEDILIVAIGDSFASGEGNPERPKYKSLKWADGMNKSMTNSHKNAHRTTLCWSAQAAMKLEKSSSKSSVTYINLAQTGGIVANAIYQLQQAKRICGNRKIDALLISVGGNDAGFTQMIATLIGRNKKDKVYSLKSIQSSFHSGNWLMLYNPLVNIYLKHFDKMFGLKPRPNLPGLNRLATEYDKLQRAIVNANIDPSNVYFMEYPTLCTYKNGNKTDYCNAMLTRVVEIARPGSDGVGLIDRTEAKWVVDYAVPKLNQEVSKACNKYNWNYIGGISKKFEGRGMCVGSKFQKSWYKGNPFPRKLPNNAGPYGRWVRHAKESKEIQGCDGADVKKCKTRHTMGMVHPNEFGHKAIAESFLTYYKSKK